MIGSQIQYHPLHRFKGLLVAAASALTSFVADTQLDFRPRSVVEMVSLRILEPFLASLCNGGLRVLIVCMAKSGDEGVRST
jgi:hypothetical protein